MTAAPSWLDIMPSIELARGVPVVRFGVDQDAPDARGVITGRMNQSPAREWIYHDDRLTASGATEDQLRMDLDDPQGFAYALRWLMHRTIDPELDAWTHRWRCGKTTTFDRVALAKACAKAVRP